MKIKDNNKFYDKAFMKESIKFINRMLKIYEDNRYVCSNLIQYYELLKDSDKYEMLRDICIDDTDRMIFHRRHIWCLMQSREMLDEIWGHILKGGA